MKTEVKKNFIATLSFLLLLSCSYKEYEAVDTTSFIGLDSDSSSTKNGNLIADAIKEDYKLDVVLYPSDFLKNNNLETLSINNSIIESMPSGSRDEFIIGTLKGSDIQKLIYQRATEKFSNPFQVAGIKYDIHFVGGIVRHQYFLDEDENRFDEDKIYRVAISKYFFNDRDAFPNYEYKNGLTYSLRMSDLTISAKDSVKKYLLSNKDYNPRNWDRARVTKQTLGSKGDLSIPEIQGTKFMSEYYGYEVTTTGVVTAVGEVENYPGGIDILFQSSSFDNDPRTSEALKISILDQSTKVKPGDLIKVTGVVYEVMSNTGLSATTLRDIKEIRILAKDVKMPPTLHLTKGKTEIPSEIISTYKGNVNEKSSLDVSETLDFLESIEHMQVKISNPRVLGFRGGNEDMRDPSTGQSSAKSHLTLYVKADGDKFDGMTHNGGLILDEHSHNHNPEIIQISTGQFSKGIFTNHFYKVGDLIEGELSGVLTYNMNLFGDGEYVFMTPTPQPQLGKDSKSDQMRTAIYERPSTSLISDEDSLTVATFNIENLGGNQDARIKDLALSLKSNLKCPDIVNLVEVQDNNSADFTGTSEADVTLSKIIEQMQTKTSITKDNQQIQLCHRQYKAINIDPLAFNEGGEPGGNIRVAMIYDPTKVKFVEKKIPAPFADTIVQRNGSLSYNPGRVFPNDSAFKGSRRSIVSEFIYKGKRVFIIGNHFNSKLGDSSLYGAIQPFSSGSETRRIKIAAKINEFVRLLQKRDPEAGIIVLGDFNANINETSMQVLKGDVLFNLIEENNFVEERNRYTTNHNGNSQALDYIFSNEQMNKFGVELEVLNMNSDFMARISDHDPLIAKFNF